MAKFTVEAENSELVLRNSNGDHVIIPAKNRAWVQRKLAEGCHECIDKLVETLPVAKEYAKKGTVVPAKASGPPAKSAVAPIVPVTPVVPVEKPTYADSLALYENALALREFYEKNKKYATDLTRKQPIETIQKRLEQSLAGMQNKQNRGYRTNVIIDGNRTAAVVPVSDFNKPVPANPNQYYQREIENSVLNMNAPMALIDKRIPPNAVQFYREKTEKNPDLVTVATYDPEKIKPKNPPVPIQPTAPSDTTANIPTPKPIPQDSSSTPVAPKPAPKPAPKILTRKDKLKLLKYAQRTGRVSFGTSDNRPMNSPGPSGRGGWSNRLEGKGAIPTAVQKILSFLTKKGR